jgi:hypothetical protein
VRRDGYALTVRITGEKTRNCKLRRTWGQVYYSNAATTDASVQRVSPGPQFGSVDRPVGVQTLGDLVIAPVPPDAREVILRVEHDCDGRDVASVLGKVAL